MVTIEALFGFINALGAIANIVTLMLKLHERKEK